MNSHGNLLQLLRWDDHAHVLVDELDNRRLDFIANSLAVALASGSVSAPAEPWLTQLHRLSLAAMHRLLRSPALCQAVRTHDSFRVGRLIEGVVVLDLCPQDRLDDWDALGHVWLGKGLPPLGCVVELDQAAGRHRGPTVFGRIPIDLSLEAVPRFPSAALGESMNVSADVSPDAVRKIDDAVRLLSDILPPAATAVTQMTSNLVLRSVSTSDHFRSATSAAAIGRVLFVNAGSGRTTIADLVEGLVHETIHTLASCQELDQPLAEPGKDCCKLRSPWTGATLHHHAFIHACLVWFGVLHLWLACEQFRPYREPARRRIDEIRAGFRELDLERCHSAAGSIVPQATYSLLSELRKRALS